ncbi:MAG: long-chain acyl-CoA synthetase [Cellvibrionaceae bacterium]|jgi:long-chain acyl-CoA synthetase
MNQPETLSQYFLARVNMYTEPKEAIRQKEFGIWRTWTWAESYETVRAFSLGMMELGLTRDEHVCAVGDNDREYLWAYLGVLTTGAGITGMFTDAIATEMAYIINHSDSTYVLAQDQEQCDKMLEIQDQVPNVRKVIYWDDRGLWNLENDWLISFTEVCEIGRAALPANPTKFEDAIWKGDGADIALISYTSGTTGLPKGVMLTHNNIVSVVLRGAEIEPRYDTDNHLSFAPLGWIVETALGFAPHVILGVIMNFPEEPETVRENIREIAPEVLFYNARLWDQLLGLVQVRMSDATRLNQWLYKIFLPVGYKIADAKFNRTNPGIATKIANTIGDFLVFAPLRNQLGMVNLRGAITAGTVLSPDHMRWFHAIGINLKQIYGSTEVCGGTIGHYNNDIKVASVGKPFPGLQMRVTNEGEIHLGGSTVMKGYYKDPEKTAEDLAIDSDGTRWFKTGDAGYIDEDGHLIFQDRLKNMLHLKSGETFSPQFIEGRLKFSPYIKDVMAIGDETRDHVTALVIVDFDNVAHWAENQGIGFTTFTDLAQKEQVYELVTNSVNEVNQFLDENGRVRHFVLMHKEFDADEEEMTRSRKLKRNVLADKYSDIINAMYDGRDRVNVKAVVTYQDGSQGLIETDLRVMAL